jgi:hypothetical protein
MATDKNRDKNLGQEGNQNWDDQNDKPTSGSREPNPERFEDKNLGQGQQTGQQRDENSERSEGLHETDSQRGGSAFNERHQSTSGAGSSQRSERENVGPLDSDLNDLPSEKRSGSNQTGPGLG